MAFADRSTALPETKSYEQLQHLLKQQYDPKPLFIAERFYISQRNQAEGESIADYIAELRHMSANCEYGKFLSEFLDQALCNRFVAGLKSEGLPRQLLSEEKLTFAQAVQKAKAFEVAEMNSKALKYPEPMTMKKLAPTSPCFRCGKSNHLPEECRFQNATCHSCGQTGNISPVGKSKACVSSQTKHSSQGKQRTETTAKTTWMVSTTERASDSDELSIQQIHVLGARSSSQPYFVDMVANDHPLCMELHV